MQIEIPNDHPDKEHIKNLVEMAFKNPKTANVLAFTTDKGNYVSMIYDLDKKLQRYLVKQYFEGLKIEIGENHCWDDFRLIMDEIERGD